MVIDIILNRKDGFPTHYTPEQFYREIYRYGEIGWGITKAMDYGTETDVKTALCEYIIRNGYNPDICGYVWSKNWLAADPT